MKIFILLLALSFSSFSAELIIKNTNFIKVERYHQFKVEFHHDNGDVIDVTDKATYFVDSRRSVGNGRFLFSLPRHSRGEMIYKNLRVNYQHGRAVHTANARLYIDPTPDFIQVNGPFYLQSNSIYQFRAIGYYGGRAFDLSRNGNWMAFRGFAMNAGLYRAPIVRGRGRVVNDSLVFSFGRGRYTKSLTIRSF